MIEALKELTIMLKDVPDMAIWILGGFLFYKLFVLGSIVGSITAVVRLAIIKWHDYSTKPKPPVEEIHSIDGYFIGGRKTYGRLLALLSGIKNTSDPDGDLTYIHVSDIDFVMEAVKEKKEKEGQAALKK